jgi:hypothetical protein
MEQRVQKAATKKSARSSRQHRRLFNLHLPPLAPVENQGVSQPRDPFEQAKRLWVSQFRIPCVDTTGGMIAKEIRLGFLFGLLLVASTRAEVRVSVQDTNGIAWITYACTAGEVVRAFALDVSVDKGQIVGVFGFFRGLSQPGSTGYGVFPASFRDYIVVGSGTNIDWSRSDYTPLADVSDSPGNTLPGLNSPGVTLELGGLWDPTVPAAIPGPSGTLCALQLSQSANVSVAANVIRGGVVSAFPGTIIQPVFIGGPVGPQINSATLQNGVMTVLFSGGELQTAAAADGPWTDTGNLSGIYMDPVGTNQAKFYRVRGP